MTVPPRGLPTRFAIALIIVGFLWAVALTWRTSENTKDRNRRLGVQQEELRRQQNELAVDEHNLAVQQRTGVLEHNERVTSNCDAANEEAKKAVTDALRLADRLFPEPRSVSQQAAVTAYVGATIDANPQRDCSPSALHLLPVPAVPPLVTVPAATEPPGIGRATTMAVVRPPHPPPSRPPRTTPTTVCKHRDRGKPARCRPPA